MIKVKNINGEPEYIPEKYISAHSDNEYFYFYENENEIPIIDFGTVVVRDVATWKLKAVLKINSLLIIVENALNNLPEPTKTIALFAWEYSPTINMYSPTVQVIKQACNLSDQNVDEIFTQAEQINI